MVVSEFRILRSNSLYSSSFAEQAENCSASRILDIHYSYQQSTLLEYYEENELINCEYTHLDQKWLVMKWKTSDFHEFTMDFLFMFPTHSRFQWYIECYVPQMINRDKSSRKFQYGMSSIQNNNGIFIGDIYANKPLTFYIYLLSFMKEQTAQLYRTAIEQSITDLLVQRATKMKSFQKYYSQNFYSDSKLQQHIQIGLPLMLWYGGGGGEQEDDGDDGFDVITNDLHDNAIIQIPFAGYTIKGHFALYNVRHIEISDQNSTSLEFDLIFHRWNQYSIQLTPSDNKIQAFSIKVY